LSWTVGPTDKPHKEPREFVPAEVPGAVQLDWARDKGWPSVDHADTVADYAWMEDSWWVYRTTLAFDPPNEDERLFFVCGGVDYRFQVRLEGEILLDQEGMFTPVELDLTERAEPGQVLEVLVFPAPKTPGEVGRAQANQSVKPAVSYGWDFHPRLIPLGIWQPAGLEIRPATYLRDAEVVYELTEDCSRAELALAGRLSQAGEVSLRWRLAAPDGTVVHEDTTDVFGDQFELDTELADPLLWWPWDQGRPNLYHSTVELLSADGTVLDTRHTRVGLRRVRLVMYPGQWDNLSWQRPMGPAKPPITLEINGRSIFCRGSNFAPPDVFPGRVTDETYRPLVQAARDANMNMLRCWGGGFVPKDGFFDLCDEMGILVWQEFPLSCNRYEGTPEYLSVLDAESRRILQRLRGRACVVLWCAGNELFNTWSGMTPQDHAVRLLDRNCLDLDPSRPFLATAPQYGMGHGDYVFLRDGEEAYQMIKRSDCTAYTEFGVPGPASMETLREIIAPEELQTPRPGGTWSRRFAFDAWDGHVQTWLHLETLQHYFGEFASTEDMVEAGQLLQAEGLRTLFEDARRQKPASAMALNWCFNEPWPVAANSSVIGWPCRPKRALQTIGRALRPVLASVAIPKFTWRAGEEFCVTPWILNDAPVGQPGGMLLLELALGAATLPIGEWAFPGVAANTHQAGPELRLTLPNLAEQRFELTARVLDQPEWNSTYVLLRARDAR
jgi:beta-mannosidase